MNTSKIPLSMVKVASPCTASWEAMSGNDQARFCGQCAEYVYNFSAMTQDEVRALIKEKEGKVCVRFYQRADGTMMTADCPVGVGIGRRLALLRGLAVGLFLAMVGALTIAASGRRDRSEDAGRGFSPLQYVKDWFFRPAPPCIMGKM